MDRAAGHNLVAKARLALLWTGGTAIITQASSWALTLWTARILDPTDYGIVAMSQILAPFMVLIASLNLGTWIVQTSSFGARERAAMYGLTSALGLLMTLAGLAIAPLVGQFFSNEQVVDPFRVLSLTFVLQASSAVPIAILRRDLDLKPIALLNLITGVSAGLLQLGLALLGFGYWSLVAGNVFRAVAITIWAHLHVGLPRRVTWHSTVNRKALAFGLPATFALLAAMVYTSADKAIIGRLFSVEFLGYYTMAFFLTDLPLAKINEVLRPVSIPYFARLDSRERIREHFALYTLSFTSLIFPVLVGLAAIAPGLIQLVLGDKWSPVVTPLRVLCLVGLARTFVDNIPHLLFALGKPVAVLRIRLVYVACMPAARPTCGLAEGNRNSGRRLQPQCSSASSLLAPDGRRSFRGYSTTRSAGPHRHARRNPDRCRRGRLRQLVPGLVSTTR